MFGGLAGLEGQQLLWPALAGAVVTALALGLMNPQRAHLDDNTVLSFLFSATMGLAFLGIGLYGILGKSDNDVRSLCCFRRRCCWHRLPAGRGAEGNVHVRMANATDAGHPLAKWTEANPSPRFRLCGGLSWI